VVATYHCDTSDELLCPLIPATKVHIAQWSGDNAAVILGGLWTQQHQQQQLMPLLKCIPTWQHNCRAALRSEPIRAAANSAPCRAPLPADPAKASLYIFCTRCRSDLSYVASSSVSHYAVNERFSLEAKLVIVTGRNWVTRLLHLAVAAVAAADSAADEDDDSIPPITHRHHGVVFAIIAMRAMHLITPASHNQVPVPSIYSEPSSDDDSGPLCHTARKVKDEGQRLEFLLNGSGWILCVFSNRPAII